VYSEAFLSEVEAIQRERQLKRWSAAKKESLIMGDIQKLKRLSKPRS
jgi:predicted GIY-YIG superfamily endonuclease